MSQTIAVSDDAAAPDTEAIAHILEDLAQDIVDPARPRPIATAPRESGASVMLFCPRQGGWHVGQWWPEGRGGWVASIDTSIGLDATHWAPLLLPVTDE